MKKIPPKHTLYRHGNYYIVTCNNVIISYLCIVHVCAVVGTRCAWYGGAAWLLHPFSIIHSSPSVCVLFGCREMVVYLPVR